MTRPDKLHSGRRLRVAVLMGGTSSEREVSLVSGRMVAAALDPNRYEVMALDTRDLPRLAAEEESGVGGQGPERLGAEARAQRARDEDRESPEQVDEALSVSSAAEAHSNGSAGTAALSSRLADDWSGERPDVVFIALHGKGGEDGTVQGMLEVLGLPYTGSGVLASALAMDKVMSKRVFQSAGIPVIEGIYITRQAMAAFTEADFLQATQQDVETRLGLPVFVKPNRGGSTCGCTLVDRPDGLYAAVREALKHDETALIEKYVRGTEITIGVLDCMGDGPTALPVIEIVPKGEYYDYESKYSDGGSEHIIPARLPAEILARAQEIARECHAVLGCRGVSRTDIIVSDGALYVLEVNTIPGMTPTSLLPQAAEYAGISFPQLLDRLVKSAVTGK